VSELKKDRQKRLILPEINYTEESKSIVSSKQSFWFNVCREREIAAIDKI
jgi:hypothetical protein